MSSETRKLGNEFIHFLDASFVFEIWAEYGCVLGRHDSEKILIGSAAPLEKRLFVNQPEQHPDALHI
jgi:hypothetical protein